MKKALAFFLMIALIFVISGCSDGINYSVFLTIYTYGMHTIGPDDISQATIIVEQRDCPDKMIITIAEKEFELQYTDSYYDFYNDCWKHAYKYTFMHDDCSAYDTIDAIYDEEYELRSLSYDIKSDLTQEQCIEYAEEFIISYVTNIEDYERDTDIGEKETEIKYISKQEGKATKEYKINFETYIINCGHSYIRGGYKYYFDLLPLFDQQQKDKIDIEKCNDLLEKTLRNAYKNAGEEVVSVDLESEIYATESGKLALMYNASTYIMLENEIKQDETGWCVISDITIDG